jgi:hypothetical protein
LATALPSGETTVSFSPGIDVSFVDDPPETGIR